MRKDYANQTRIRLIWNGKVGTIISNQSDSVGIKMYTVLLDGAAREMLIDYESIAPVDHPIHKKMEQWRAECIAKGFTSIVIGITGKGYKAFYCNDPQGYATIVRNNPDIKFKYYWRID